MMSVKSSSTGANIASNVSLTVWQDCPEDRDRILIRDGSRIEDPVLLVYCGGPLPRITARGPAMLVEFSSSSVAVPLGASQLRVELETQVLYIYYTPPVLYNYYNANSCVGFVLYTLLYETTAAVEHVLQIQR